MSLIVIVIIIFHFFFKMTVVMGIAVENGCLSPLEIALRERSNASARAVHIREWSKVVHLH